MRGIVAGGIACAFMHAGPARADDPGSSSEVPVSSRSVDLRLERQMLGLVSDVRRIVGARETLGWFDDEAAFDAIRTDLLQSVCRSVPEARAWALAELKADASRAGDPEALYRKDGRRVTPRVEAALTAWRSLRALELSLEEAGEHCPFWIEPNLDFEARQSVRNGLSLHAEGGGVVQVRQTEDTWTLGAGGYGRLLVGLGFDGRATMLVGGEFGGGALIRPNTKPTEFVITYLSAIPMVFRLHDAAWHYEVEVGPVGLFEADDFDLSYGFRTGVGLGLSGLNTSGIVPWAGLAVAYDHYLPTGGRERTHFFRAGLRVGFVYDP